MQATARGAGAARHAITDLYDEQRRFFLIQYPIWFIITLALLGVVAFAMSGFLGYDSGSAFRQPWELFLWFCALLLTLQVSIFRDASLRRRLFAMLIVSLLAIFLVGVTYFSNSLPDYIRQLLDYLNLSRWVTYPITYTIINFLLLTIFWVDTVRRWTRRARGMPPNPRVSIGLGAREQVDPDDLPTMSELVSGDLIAGAVLAVLLSLLFRTDIINLFVHPHIDTCTVSWVIGNCPRGGGGGLADPPTLTFIDLIQSLIYLPIGLLILALSATLSGLAAVRGVNERELDETEPAHTGPDTSSTQPIAEDVATTVLNTLRSALDRRIRLLVSSLVLAFRNVAWPALIFVATYGIAELSTNLQNYLHSGKSFEAFAGFVLPGVAWGLAATLGVVFSAALFLFRWHVAENTLRFLGLVGFVVLLTFWIFSLAEWGFNQLLLQTHASVHHPFDPPTYPTGVSLAALLVTVVVLVLRRMRTPQPAERVATPVRVGGTTHPTETQPGQPPQPGS